MNTLWFVCSNDTHVKMFALLANELQQQQPGSWNCAFVSLDAYYNQGVEEAARTVAPACRIIRLPRPRPLNTNFYQRGLVAIWQDTLFQAGPAIGELLKAPPDLVLLGNDRGLIEKMFIRRVQQSGIKTLLVQDGKINPNEGATWKYRLRHTLAAPLKAFGLNHLAPTKYGEGACDHVAVYSEWARQIFMERGAKGESVAVVGQLRYDAILEKLVQTTNDSQHVKVVVLPTAALWNLYDQHLHERQLDELRDIYSALNELLGDRFDMIIKLHPRDDVQHYQLLHAGGAMPRARVIKDADLIDLIVGSDFVITSMSTAWLEAALCRRACLITNLHLSNTSVAHIIIDKPGLRPHTSKEQLKGSISKFIEDRAERDRYIQQILEQALVEVYFSPDEKAVTRLVGVCQSLVTTAKS